jgi:hypothetical protein
MKNTCILFGLIKALSIPPRVETTSSKNHLEVAENCHDRFVAKS